MVVALFRGHGGPERHQILTAINGYYGSMENLNFSMFLMFSVCNTTK